MSIEAELGDVPRKTVLKKPAISSVLAGILAGKADRVLSVDHGAADRGVAAVDSVDQAVSAVDMDTGMADEVAGAAMKKADTVAVEAVVAEDVAATDGTTTDGITATAGEAEVDMAAGAGTVTLADVTAASVVTAMEALVVAVVMADGTM
ncbi:hypothetical protein AAVH_36275, partial [Aphelenchoides avenae]